MKFMRVVRKDEYIPCAYFIDGKRVSIDEYFRIENEVTRKGRIDCLITMQTKKTWQHCASGRILD